MKLPNLERVYFEDGSTDDIFPFIRSSPKLKIVKFYRLQGGSHYRGFFDLTLFNKERKKLAGACKVIIYINENLICWHMASNYKIKYKLVELDRFQWFEWKELNTQYRHNKLK